VKFHKIENNVPIHDVNSKSKYPWPEMAVGDSVFIEAEKGETPTRLAATVSSSVRYHGRKTGKKFRTRVFSKENGIRVWRVD